MAKKYLYELFLQVDMMGKFVDHPRSPLNKLIKGGWVHDWGIKGAL